MPIIIHLGDFLQLKPTGGNTSLVDDFAALAAAGVDLSPEYQAVMKLFCRTPPCFELQASNRFKEPKLRELMAFMRSPGRRLPHGIKETWESICLKPVPGGPHDGLLLGYCLEVGWSCAPRAMRPG